MNESEQAIFKDLTNRLDGDRPWLTNLDQHYEGNAHVRKLGLAIPPELSDFETMVNWSRMVVDAIEERLDIEGFRYPNTDDADEDLWNIWQANDLDQESQIGHLEALALGRAYICVGSNEADPANPLITIESPLEMAHTLDPRTRRMAAALRRYGENGVTTALGTLATFATLYLPEATIWLERSEAYNKWVEVDRDTHYFGEVPVVPLINRARTRRRYGISEMSDVIPLVAAAARSLTNLQVAQETHAVPQRGVLGATQGDFVDKDGRVMGVWESYFSGIWAMENENAKTFQFSASDLRNFHDTVMHYAHLVGSITGLPLRYMGVVTSNPPSAEGIRADEARLVKRCERKQRGFEGSWEGVMRLAKRFRGEDIDQNAKRLETLWRDPSTPTDAQMADVAVKLHAEGILPTEAAWEELGYSATRRAKLRAMRDEQTSMDLLGSQAEFFRQQPTVTPVEAGAIPA